MVGCLSDEIVGVVDIVVVLVVKRRDLWTVGCKQEESAEAPEARTCIFASGSLAGVSGRGGMLWVPLGFSESSESSELLELLEMLKMLKLLESMESSELLELMKLLCMMVMVMVVVVAVVVALD